jgi:hypothetical protein
MVEHTLPASGPNGDSGVSRILSVKPDRAERPAALAGIECLPWDYWGIGRHFLATFDVTEEEERQIDALAEALDPVPATGNDASAILDRFPWARPTETVSSVIVATPVEVPIKPSHPGLIPALPLLLSCGEPTWKRLRPMLLRP